MSFPMILPLNWVSLYGVGNTIGISGLIPDNTNIRFATIYGLGNGNILGYSVGDSVMFKEEDVICRLAWDNKPYTMIELEKLGGTEVPPP